MIVLFLKNYKEDFLKKWRENKLDACICSGFAFPAVPSGKVTNVVGEYSPYYNIYL
jgi:hypothetical protein